MVINGLSPLLVIDRGEFRFGLKRLLLRKRMHNFAHVIDFIPVYDKRLAIPLDGTAGERHEAHPRDGAAVLTSCLGNGAVYLGLGH